MHIALSHFSSADKILQTCVWQLQSPNTSVYELNVCFFFLFQLFHYRRRYLCILMYSVFSRINVVSSERLRVLRRELFYYLLFSFFSIESLLFEVEKYRERNSQQRSVERASRIAFALSAVPFKKLNQIVNFSQKYVLKK